jgi:uncharacterized protein (UPF0548 family)
VSDLTYVEAGATRQVPLPANYDHLHYRTMLGTGADVFARAAEAVLTFRMHRAAGLRVTTEAERAAPGVRLTIGLGPVAAPCEVVYTIEEPSRAGFAYGTLPGHPERGEEAFVVERDAQDRVWFRMVAFSRPARLGAMLGGPVTMLLQRGYARLCGRALKRLSASRTVGP